MIYEWVKVAHLLAVISWMAGLLYLPRLMVYHADAEKTGELADTLKIMQRRLLKAIMTPAMIASWVFGIWLSVLQNLWDGLPVWFSIKLVCLGVMTATHFYLAARVKKFALNQNELPSRAYRVINEIPTTLMIVIIIMVVVKPFS